MYDWDIIDSIVKIETEVENKLIGLTDNGLIHEETRKIKDALYNSISERIENGYSEYENNKRTISEERELVAEILELMWWVNYRGWFLKSERNKYINNLTKEYEAAQERMEQKIREKDKLRKEEEEAIKEMVELHRGLSAPERKRAERVLRAVLAEIT